MPRGKPASGTRRQRRPATFDGIPVPESIRGNGARGAFAKGWRAASRSASAMVCQNPYPRREPGEPWRYIHACHRAFELGWTARQLLRQRERERAA